MRGKTKFLKQLVLAGIGFSFLGLNAQNYADKKSESILNAMAQVIGSYDKLDAKKDVQFHYVYDNFEAGKDISVERHIFNGEHSWATYNTHQRNVLPTQKGIAKQALIDGEPTLTLDGKSITEAKAIAATVFLRKVNFYWFTMMYKLQDPGTQYTYLGTEDVDGISYDKVSLIYDATITKKEKNDAYILFFNPKTHLVDLFYFSIPDWGINDPILKMVLKYEIIEGIYVTTERTSYGPDKNGVYQRGGVYTFSDIKFNNGFNKADFELK